MSTASKPAAAAAAAASFSAAKPAAAAAAAAAGASMKGLDGSTAAPMPAPAKDDGKGDKKDAGAIKGLDDDIPLGKLIKLSSKDKKEFVVERKYAYISVLVKTSLENDDKAEEVPIPGVTGAILARVVAYMNEHKGVEPPIIEKPLKSKIMKDVCPHTWDADFIDGIGASRQELYDVILAANYMDIKSLMHLGCAKIGALIKGQALEKIKDILNPDQKKAGVAAPAGPAAPAAKPAAPAAGAGDAKAAGPAADKKDDKKKPANAPAAAAAAMADDAPASAAAPGDAPASKKRRGK